ncbi:type IV pilus twitching motility protein PilT [Candidatus Saganbacteria bacterium]|nr:type IV pilus twitching motility protein PilT [Candidatus Saganbacteria bacterium]
MQIDALLEIMGKQNASDLIITVNNPPVFRISKDLVRSNQPAFTKETAKEIIYQMLSAEQKADFEKEKEIDIAYQLKETRFRVNVHYERGNAACAIRRLSSRIPTLQELLMPKAVEDFSRLTQGLILVTGVTGAGKSTTQASMINLINQSRPCHIITIEDPIEYIHANKKSIVEQREVGIDTETFASALRRVLRQNPDVILVGEMRDLETIQTAITAAETGHLVISTLHTPDAAQAIDRMIDVFPPAQQAQIRLQLSLTIQGVVAQKLLQKKDKSGVVAAVEILAANGAVRNIIRKSATQDLYSTIETGSKFGMVSMDNALKDLYRAKLISEEAAIENSRNPDEMAKKLKLA